MVQQREFVPILQQSRCIIKLQLHYRKYSEAYPVDTVIALEELDRRPAIDGPLATVVAAAAVGTVGTFFGRFGAASFVDR